MATGDASQRSALKDFLGSIATIKGDLSNITAPPFVLGTQSTTELPSYWAEYPSIFNAPAAESSPETRALLVLKWFLVCLRRQQYGGRPEAEGVKKPLNAFLGELFVADFQDSSTGTTHLISEQVSHHPPITACCLWNDETGIRAEGYAAQKITFNGSVNVKQMGHAIITLTKHNESHLIPLPAVKVSGILTGTPYPELGGHYQVVSSSGFVSEIDFSGKKALGFGGEKHHVHAAIFKTDDKSRKHPLYEIEGQWNGILDVTQGGKSIEKIDVQRLQPVQPSLPAEEQQSPYESRRAWAGVIASLNKGNMQGVVDEKSKIEEAQRSQRQKRGDGEQQGWEPIFFKKLDKDEAFEALAKDISKEQEEEEQVHGFWKFDPSKVEKQRPFRDGTPWDH